MLVDLLDIGLVVNYLGGNGILLVGVVLYGYDMGMFIDLFVYVMVMVVLYFLLLDSVIFVFF